MAKRKRTSSGKGAKPSAKQLAARKRFIAMAKARSAKSSKSKPKARKSSKSRPVLKADKPAPVGLYNMPLKRKKPLKPRASGRKSFSGPDSNQEDVSKVTVRTPTLLLEPMTAPNPEIDFSGWSRMGW